LGIDTLDFSATTSKSIVVNLSSTAAQTVNSNLTLTLSSGTGLENVIGGSLADTLTGNSRANVLTGGPGNDTYLFLADDALGNDTISDAAGTDTISFAGTSAAVSLSLSNTAQQTVNANLKLTLTSASALENLTGGSGNDILS